MENMIDQHGQGKQQNPYICALLNLLFGGLGYIVLGQAERALKLWFIVIGVATIFALTGIFPTFAGILGYCLLLLCTSLFWLIDGFLLARTAPMQLKWYNHWSCYLLWIVALSSASEIPAAIREPVLGYGIYSAKSESLVPDIKSGEIFVVNTAYFKLAAPKINDIVAVKSPKHDVAFIRRIAAIAPSGNLTLRANAGIKTQADEELTDISATNLIGRVTDILYSPEFGRIGKAVQ